MNQFKSLDLLFPTGAARLSGEVVSTTFIFKNIGVPSAYKSSGDATISWKRKAWYVNASVNAFHMHRGLVGEARKIMNFHGFTDARQRKVKQLIARAVYLAYVGNHKTGRQYFAFELDFERNETEVTLFASNEVNSDSSQWDTTIEFMPLTWC